MVHKLISAELPRHDHSIIACSRHIYVWCYSSRTYRSWWMTQSAQHHRRGCNTYNHSPLKISASCILPVTQAYWRHNRKHSAHCLTFTPYCSLETNLVTSFAASLKLSAHTLAHNYSEPRKLFEGFKGFRYLFLMRWRGKSRFEQICCYKEH